ncbi:MAG TPA: zinc metalloprotease HtpX [Actinomycetota bacterium]|nr:zinc metalloprotease HtpX [Actinomycetota bacterium]
MATTRNTMKTILFMGVLTALLLLVGDVLGKRYFGGSANGMVFFLFIAVAINFASYWWSDKIVLKVTRSRPVTEQEAPWFYKVVRELTQKSGMPMPRLYVMPASQPNAFATGRDEHHAAVAVTEGILQVLNEEELAGVLAHELSHVRNHDILIGAVAATVAAGVMMIARVAMFGAIFGGGGRNDREGGGLGALLSIILAPIAAVMIQMAVSRSREAQADASGAHLLGDATPLANALIKIDAASKRTPPLAVNPAVSHLFLQSPFRGGQGVSKLFMSHPPLEERLAQLRELGARV